MMRKVLIAACCFLTFILVPTGHSQAKSPQTADMVLIYTLQLVKVADTKPLESVWMIQSLQNAGMKLDGIAFKSLAAPELREWISHLPAQTAILYTESSLPSLGHNHWGDRAEVDIPDFVRFCRSKHLQFGFNPTL